MQYDANSPIWAQVMNVLRTQIASGQRPPGEKLPGGRELALQFGINPNTAARVYREMERVGLCETRRGLGTFVTGDENRIAEIRRELARSAVQQCARTLAELHISREDALQLFSEEETTP